jgi:cell division protease FtsH
MAMTEEEKLATAYHEAGHAIVNIVVPGNDPLHKVTIIPRGRALGVTMSLPERDKLSYSKQWCEAKIAMAFGGRVAEQIIYGREHLNTGASSDISQATNIAKRMVTEWGMSEVLGPLLYSENQQEVFLGHSITQRQNMSEGTAKLIDEEVRRIVTAGEKKAWEVLTAHKAELEAMAQALMEYETISGDECMALMRGEKIIRRNDDEGSKGSAGSAVPTAGRPAPRPRGEPSGGMEPEPQPQ